MLLKAEWTEAGTFSDGISCARAVVKISTDRTQIKFLQIVFIKKQQSKYIPAFFKKTGRATTKNIPEN